jgi:hypothetical protein
MTGRGLLVTLAKEIEKEQGPNAPASSDACSSLAIWLCLPRPYRFGRSTKRARRNTSSYGPAANLSSGNGEYFSSSIGATVS